MQLVNTDHLIDKIIVVSCNDRKGEHGGTGSTVTFAIESQSSPKIILHLIYFEQSNIRRKIIFYGDHVSRNKILEKLEELKAEYGIKKSRTFFTYTSKSCQPDLIPDKIDHKVKCSDFSKLLPHDQKKLVKEKLAAKKIYDTQYQRERRRKKRLEKISSQISLDF